jgi:hypothetical protein
VKARSHPRALELRYVFDEEELRAMGSALRWKPTGVAKPAEGKR